MAVAATRTEEGAPMNRPADVIGIPGSSTILFQIQSFRRDILLPFFCEARLCELRAASRRRRASGGGTELLRLAAHVLEKTLLMHTDHRREGVRWYVTI